MTEGPGRWDVALAGAALLVVAAWVVTGFVDRDGDARLALSLALLALGAILVARGLARVRRGAGDRTWIGMLIFVLCGLAGVADRAGAGAMGSVLSLLSFGCGVAVLLRWRPPRAS